MRRLLIIYTILTLFIIGCSASSGSSNAPNIPSQETEGLAGLNDQMGGARAGEASSEKLLSDSEQNAEVGGIQHEEDDHVLVGGNGSLDPDQAAPEETNLTAKSDGSLTQEEASSTGDEAGAEASEQAVLEEKVELFEKKRQLPEGFVYVDEVLEHAFYEIRYYSENNFIGERIAGYNAPFAVLSEQAAQALVIAEQELEKQGYALLIYDAYRPHKAVEQFIEWAADEQDTRMKEQFYPDLDKSKVFELGYLSRRSGHSRGSTIDLTLAHMETGEPMDMGGPYDLLGEISAHDAKGLTEEQSQLRRLLKDTMIVAGFEPYRKEWWHYTLKSEPFPKKFFDFDVE